MSLNSFLYYEQIPGVIGIKTNIKGFRWGFGQCAFAVNESAFDKCKYKVIIEERRDDKVFDDIDKKSYDKEFRHFRVSKDKPGFLFEQTIAKAFKLRCCVEVCNKTIRAIVGRSYLKFVPIKLMNVHPISYIMFDLISILLLQDGLAPLYCSSVRFQDGKTIVFMAPPNTGKSLTVLQLKRDYNAEIVCEDMAITDGRFIWGAPYTALYRNYKDKSLKIERVSIDKCHQYEINAVIFLQKGNCEKTETVDDCTERIELLNRYSLGYYYSPSVRTIDYYFHNEFSISSAWEKEKNIIRCISDNSKAFLIESNNSMHFSEHVCLAICRQGR